MIKAVIFDCFGVVLSTFSKRHEQVIEYIKVLRPKYKVAMLSNVSGRAALDERFHKNELDELFDMVVASGDIGIEKPEHAIYEATAAGLGVQPSECLFIDDIPLFCQAAEQVGMRTILCDDVTRTLADITRILKEDI